MYSTGEDSSCPRHLVVEKLFAIVFFYVSSKRLSTLCVLTKAWNRLHNTASISIGDRRYFWTRMSGVVITPSRHSSRLLIRRGILVTNPRDLSSCWHQPLPSNCKCVSLLPDPFLTQRRPKSQIRRNLFCEDVKQIWVVSVSSYMLFVCYTHLKKLLESEFK